MFFFQPLLFIEIINLQSEVQVITKPLIPVFPSIL